MQCPLYHIHRFLPHSGNMVLIDKIESYNEDGLIAYSYIQKNHVFLEEGFFPAWASLEVMAQGIAALDGIYTHIQGKSPRLGFLLGTRKFSCFFDKISAPCCLKVSVLKSIQDSNGMGVFDCELSVAEVQSEEKTTPLFKTDYLLAQASLNVFSPRNPENIDKS